MLINGERALAHIQKISNIREIVGADNIEQCNVLGWNLIVKKNEFKDGDLAVYIEIDSKCPETEPFEFLRAKHFKVKTMKLGKFGVISQGLALPVSLFPEIINPKEGVDVTNLLGIIYSVAEDNTRKAKDSNIKYNSMVTRHKKISKKKWFKWLMKRNWGRKLLFIFFGKKKDNSRGFPSFISKTDEERVENQPWRAGDGNIYVITEKLDGTSCTYALKRKGKNKFEFYVCSRNVRQNDEKQECYHDVNIYWDLAFKYNIEKHLKDYLKQHEDLSFVCVQGEGVGNVQGNPLKLEENDLYIFNFKTSDGRLSSFHGRYIIENKWNMKWVPILGTTTMPNTMEEIKELATGYSILNPKVLREGVVYRSFNGQDSFKNVSREYLLKHNQ